MKLLHIFEFHWTIRWPCDDYAFEAYRYIQIDCSVWTKMLSFEFAFHLAFG